MAARGRRDAERRGEAGLLEERCRHALLCWPFRAKQMLSRRRCWAPARAPRGRPRGGAAPGAAPGAAARRGRAAAAAPPPAAAPARVRGRSRPGSHARQAHCARTGALFYSVTSSHRPLRCECARGPSPLLCWALPPQTNNTQFLTRRPCGPKLQTRSAGHPLGRRRGHSPASAGAAQAERWRSARASARDGPSGAARCCPLAAPASSAASRRRSGAAGAGTPMLLRAPLTVSAHALVFGTDFTLSGKSTAAPALRKVYARMQVALANNGAMGSDRERVGRGPEDRCQVACLDRARAMLPASRPHTGSQAVYRGCDTNIPCRCFTVA